MVTAPEQRRFLIIPRYLRVLATGINSDGFTASGITFPNGVAQEALYKQVCEKANVNAADIFYIEAHGTGTKAGDGQELEALHKAYIAPRLVDEKCSKKSAGEVSEDETSNAENNRKQGPLYIGSVKSNMGHAEGCSGAAGLVKLCLSFAEGTIPADLHYSFEERNPNPTLADRSVCQVVEKNLPLAGGGVKKVAISSFGFGGTNAHAVMESTEKNRKSEQKDKLSEAGAGEQGESWLNINPVLGRTEEGVRELSAALTAKKILFNTLTGPPPVHDLAKELSVLGFSLPTTGEVVVGSVNRDLIATGCGNTRQRPVYLCFSGNGGMWPGMGKDLYKSSPIYRSMWDRCHAHLVKKFSYTGLGKFLEENPEKPGLKITDYIATDGVCGLAALQMGLVDLLDSVNIKYAGMFGHSAGETALGYADGLLTLEETIEIAYLRGECGVGSVDPNNSGGMYAAGVPRKEAEALLKKYGCTQMSGVGCDNDPGLVTLSGSEQELKPVLVELQVGTGLDVAIGGYG